MTTVVTLDEIPLPLRAPTWRDVVCDTFVRLECAPERMTPLHGSLQAAVIGDLHIARIISSPQRVRRTAAQALATRTNEAYVLMSVQLRGSTIVQQGNAETVLTPGSLAFYDTTRPYQLATTSDFDQIVVHLPHGFVETSVPGALDSMASRLSASDPYARALFALAAPMASLTQSASPGVSDRIAATVKALFLLALGSLQMHGTRRSAPGPTLARATTNSLELRARTLIKEQLHDSALNPTRVAAQMHVSTRRLQEVFHRQGTTLHETIWEMRLELARELLLLAGNSPELTSTIAYRCGFEDPAHFSRRFKQRFGVSARELRAQVN